MFNAPDVSVIVSAYNRGEGLRETLRSLLRQDADGVDYEIVAVDNNSTDDTAAVIHSFIAEGQGRLVYAFEPRQGVSFGRNTGIRLARAPILAFTDDDVIVTPAWISAIARRLRENPEVDYVTGKMLPVYDTPPPPWITRATSGPCVLRDRGDEALYSRPGYFFPGWATANIAFRRRVFERVGLFSGEFPRGQDLELIIRVWRAGFRGMYAPDVQVSHRVPPERLTKAYHRMWHSREGAIRARVRFREIFDEEDRVRDGAERRHATLLGVPLFLVRETAAACGAWSAAWLRGDDAGAFAMEGRVRQNASYVRTCFRRERALAAPPRLASGSEVAGV